MVRKENEIRVRKITGVQGGKGEIAFIDWLIPDQDCPGHGRVISKVVIGPGCSIGYHKHVGEFEAYTVLQGTALVDDNGTEVTLTTGDMHLCKDGDGHSIECISEEPVVLEAVILNTLG